MLSDFKCYQLAKDLYQETQKIKLNSIIKNQLDRASLSIVLNLAEGSGKLTRKDKRKFYAIAMGSIREVEAIMELTNQSEQLSIKLDYLAAATWRLIQRT